MCSLQQRLMKKTLAGIAQAQRDYPKWSGGLSLRKAHESMITISVARKLIGIRDRTFDLTIEQTIRDTQKKFDIVLWSVEDPMAAIEIKKIRNRRGPITRDLNRVFKALREEPEFEFGLVAYYIADNRRTALGRTMNEIDENSRLLVENNGFNFDSCRRNIRAFDNSYWSAAVLKVAR